MLDEVVAAAVAAGFVGDALVTALAVSGGESGWRDDAVNDTRQYSEKRDDGRWYIPDTEDALPHGVLPEYSVGPWQININDTKGEPQGNTWLVAEQPETYEGGARAAYRLSNGGESFEAWSAYQSGRYKFYLDTARAAVTAVNQSQPPASPGDGGSDTVGGAVGGELPRPLSVTSDDDIAALITSISNVNELVPLGFDVVDGQRRALYRVAVLLPESNPTRKPFANTAEAVKAWQAGIAAVQAGS